MLVGLLLAVAATGTLLAPAALRTSGVESQLAHRYLPLVLANCMLCLYVSGVGLGHNVFAALLDRSRAGARHLLADLGLGVGLALLLVAAENGLQWLVGLPESTAAHALLPVTASEKLVWLGVAALVGFSEELVYRGYLQRQLAALSGSLPCGLLAQAALFGIAHGEQGSWAVGRFAVYALAFGCVAAWRRSLLPCVLCHVAVDSLAVWGG